MTITVVLGLTGIIVALALSEAGAQQTTTRPDLQGIWQTNNSAEWNLEPHEGRPDIPAGLGVVVGGTIPYKPEALAKRRENQEQRETADPISKCYMPGVPRVTYAGFPFQIVQTDSHVLILSEYAHTVRLIPTTDVPFEFDGAEFWMGESRGRYEGDSLVIESRNFTSAIIAPVVAALDPVSWTSSERWIRCPDRWQTLPSAGRAGNSMTTSRPRLSGSCSTRARAWAAWPATWT